MESFDVSKDSKKFENLRPMFWGYDLDEIDPITGSKKHIFSDIISIKLDLSLKNCEAILKSMEKGDNQYSKADLDVFKFVPVQDNLLVNVVTMQLLDGSDGNKVLKEVYKLEDKPVKKQTFYENLFAKPRELSYKFSKWGWLGKQFLH